MRIVIGVLLLLCGYLVGAVGGYTLLLTSTSNTHDGPVEAAMTGAFVAGPALPFWPSPSGWSSRARGARAEHSAAVVRLALVGRCVAALHNVIILHQLAVGQIPRSRHSRLNITTPAQL